MVEEVLRLNLADTPWATVDGETVILDPTLIGYAGVNASGTVLWPALLRGTTRIELVQLLVDAYGIDATRAGDDVDAFLQALESRGLLAGRIDGDGN